MLSFLRLVCGAALFAACGSLMPGPTSCLAAGPDPFEAALTTEERGRALFLREWSADDERSPEGDGLGPMFNARSCVECHHEGGVGGSGGKEHNVDVLSLILPTRNGNTNPAEFASTAGKIHAGLLLPNGLPASNITLHKHGGSAAYPAWRDVLLALVDMLPEGQVPGRISLAKTQRRTPALFGAGVVQSIPPDVIRREAAMQASNDGPVKGRLAIASGNGVGRFGWRGQTATLEQFVRGACSNELGLSVMGARQPADPLASGPQPRYTDLAEKGVYDLVAFVSSLPAPQQKRPANESQKHDWEMGRQAFHRVGCAECHQPKMGEVAGIYSDLLLHDMGMELSDPAGANSPGETVTPPTYYGGSTSSQLAVAMAMRRLWRTPPLWGVAMSKSYMHDGRASSIEEAVSWHHGEAAESRQRFQRLGDDVRDQVVAFLKSFGEMPN